MGRALFAGETTSEVLAEVIKETPRWRRCRRTRRPPSGIFSRAASTRIRNVYEVYVRAAGATGGRWQISTTGGEEPRWSPDGRELYYRNDTRLMALGTEARPTFQAGTPRVVVDGIYNLRTDTGISYDVDPNSRRFLMIRPASDGDASATLVRIVLNWFEELRRRTAGPS
jgi:hypothetical protein